MRLKQVQAGFSPAVQSREVRIEDMHRMTIAEGITRLSLSGQVHINRHSDGAYTVSIVVPGEVRARHRYAATLHEAVGALCWEVACGSLG